MNKQDQGQSCYCPNCESLAKQVTALKTCLEVERGFNEQENQAEQAQPVAWNEPTPDFHITELSCNTIRYHNAVHGKQDFSKNKLGECVVPVWFAPPAGARTEDGCSAPRQPLTDEQEYEAIGTAGVDLLELAKQWADNEIHVYQFDNEARKIIKAVLRRAHGIKGGA